MERSLGSLNSHIDNRKPSFWGQRAPKEQWTKTVPSTSVPEEMYDVLQDISTNPSFEFGGSMSAVVRDAIDEYIQKYGHVSPRAGLLIQMRAWRDSWVEDIIASNLTSTATVIEESFARWTRAGDVGKVVEQFNKVFNTSQILPDEYRQFVLEKFRHSSAVNEAYELVKGYGTREQQKEVEIAYDILNW